MVETLYTSVRVGIMKDILNKFIIYLKDEKNYSNYTTSNYCIDIEEFYVFLKKENITKLQDVDYKMLRKYLNYMTENKYSNRTISRKLSSLRTFFKYLVKKEIINDNPMILISNPKEEKKLPKYLNYGEIEKILEIPNKETTLGLRNACILEILYSTGIRVSELVNLKIRDIDFYNKKIRVLGKGNKERIVLFGNRCGHLLERYIKESRAVLNKKKVEYLFLNNLGQNISVRSIENIIDKIEKEACLKFSISPHVFRHTFATHLLDNGADLNSVKELLGHENLNTTAIYTHVSNERLRKVYLECHPRARGK